MADLHELTALALWQELQSGRVSPRELAAHYLDRIDRLNPQLGAFVTVTRDRALARADEVADRGAEDRAAVGAAVPATRTCGCAPASAPASARALMAGFVPDTSDEIVETLDAAGAVSLGKTNAPEFGLPAYTESLAAPPARNPWDPALGAGGSSGGAAVAVASGMLPFAPGSDGGGSVRIPAAACGLVGLKPSRGLVPAGSGIDSLAGLVVDGPLARTTADAALLLDGMIARVDGRDRSPLHAAARPTTTTAPFLGTAVRGEGRFQLGVMTTSAWDDAYEIVIAPEARAALDAAVEAFTAMGHGMEETALRARSDATRPAFRTIWQAGAARIPVEGDALDLVEPLTSWLVERGRATRAPASWARRCPR